MNKLVDVLIKPGEGILERVEQAAREAGLRDAVCVAGLGTTSLDGTPLELCGITGALADGTAQLACTAGDGQTVRPYVLSPADRCLHFCRILLAERLPETERLVLADGADLLEAVSAYCAGRRLHRAVILDGGGSLRRTSLHFATMDPEMDFFRDREGPAALSQVSGFFDSGRAHLHARAGGQPPWAGHVEPGCLSAGDVYLEIAGL